jgi:hypothetical protein
MAALLSSQENSRGEGRFAGLIADQASGFIDRGAELLL